MHRHCAPFLFSKRSPSQTKSARKRCKAPCPRKRRYAGPPRQRPRARPRLRQTSARLKTVRAALAAELLLRKPVAPAPPGARPRLCQASARLKTVRAALPAEAPLRRPAAPAPPGRVRAFVRHLRVSKQRKAPCPRKRRYASPPRQRPGRVRAFVRRKGGVNRAIGVRPLARRMRIPKSAQGRPERKTVAAGMARAPPQGRGRSAGAPDQRPQDVLVFSEKRFSRLA